jgi:hypothetical protein
MLVFLATEWKNAQHREHFYIKHFGLRAGHLRHLRHTELSKFNRKDSALYKRSS